MAFLRSYLDARSRWVRISLVAMIAAVASVATYGLTAANTVPASKAGDGAGAITGYAISAVDYTLNATNPANVDTVRFTLDSSPATGSEVKVKLVSTGSTWYSCTFTGAAVTCATTSPQATVAASNQLTVIAAD